ISFIEGFSTREQNLVWLLYYKNYQSLWSLWKRNLETNKKIVPLSTENNARLNNLEDRIKRIEERFEKIKNWQDKQDLK
ncbi:MAG TPA: hypothetical protein VK431_05035, partial [Nitrosopumilaceae archaeon]|nr:hypothetical protein [Nitrosopumilaceae archaeon]